jgi:hypothetical protein
MNYTENFEDDGFFYTLTVQPTEQSEKKLYVICQGDGYRCEWKVRSKTSARTNSVLVTDDNCNPIVYPNVETARAAAKRFISISNT